MQLPDDPKAGQGDAVEPAAAGAAVPSGETPINPHIATPPLGEAEVQQLIQDAPDEELPPLEPFTPDQPGTNHTVTRPVTKPLPDKQPEPSLSDCVAILRETVETVTQVLNHSSAIMERMITSETKLAEAIGRTADFIPDDKGDPHLRLLLGALSRQIVNDPDRHTAALHREGSHWGQTVEHEGKHIGGGIPVQRLAADGKYTREELKSYVTRKAGVGGTVDMPLWHSGIWLRFKAPSLVELTAMNQEVAQVKVSVGSETRGLAFSNVAHYIKTIVVDFALQHVSNANVSFATPTDLKPLIDTRDIPAVILGLAATLYPAGYPYASPCIADIGKCNHITKELMQVVNMWWVDMNGLTPWQKTHMAFRIDARAPRTKEDLATYKSHHVYGRERLVQIGEMGFLLQCPSVWDHEELGRAWLTGIIEMTQGAFNEPPEGRNRTRFIEQLAESTAAREYTHWIKAIVDINPEAPDGYVVLSEEKDFIADILSDVYSADEHIKEFNDAVEKYIDDSLIAMTAINSFNCPVCNTPAATKFKERFENLITVDPLAEFFMLASRKLSRIM
jgi:hypothetical protein